MGRLEAYYDPDQHGMRMRSKEIENTQNVQLCSLFNQVYWLNSYCTKRWWIFLKSLAVLQKDIIIFCIWVRAGRASFIIILARFQSLMDDNYISDDDIIHALERAENRAVSRIPQDFHMESDVSKISSLPKSR